MPSTDPSVKIEKVLQEELDEIIQRRKAAGLLPAAADPSKVRGAVAADLVGLALSGGGIRSASFNLGLLQVLHEQGFLNRVDYLSTVSGGGYIGSFLSSMVLHSDVQMNEQFPLRSEPSGKQPPAVRKLLRGGTYLNRPLEFFNRYIMGFFFNNLTLFSGMVLLCAVIAYGWRLLDTYPIRDWLAWMSDEWLLDWSRPFLPSVLLLLAWLAVWVLAHLLPGWKRLQIASKVLLFLAGTTTMIGVVVWLANPNISVTSSHAENSLQRNFLSEHQYIITPLLACLGASLLPFLSPRNLLQSGQKPRGHWQNWVFRLACTALLIGIPLGIVYYLARHNLSGQADRLDRDLVDTDIRDWKLFWTRVQKAEGSPEEASSQPLREVNELLRDQAIQDDVQRALGEKNLIAAQAKRNTVAKLNRRLNGDQVIVSEKSLTILHRELETAARTSPKDRSEPHAAPGESLFPEERTWLVQLVHQADLDLSRLESADRQALNHLLVRLYYPDETYRRTMIRRGVVIDADQSVRWKVVLVALVVFMLSAAIVNLNSTSMHRFYRDQLAQAYIVPTAEHGRQIPLHQLETTAKGGPYHLITAALNVLGKRRSSADNEPPQYTVFADSFTPDDPEPRPSLLPARDRQGPERELYPTTTFLFSRRYCGSALTGFCATAEYMDGQLDLATAMALSGAAMNPLREPNLLVACLMTIMNIRLGQWLPNPAGRCEPPTGLRRVLDFLLQRPTVLGLLLELRRPYLQRKTYFITDGGDNENLGLGALLRRECKLIVASDASQDGDHGFSDLVKLYRRSHLRGIRFFELIAVPNLDKVEFLRLEPLSRDTAKRLCAQHFVLAKICYPSGREGLLIYLKPSLTGDEEIDLLRFHAENPDFPHHPTTNQLYDEVHVDSYRRLGYHIGEMLCRRLDPVTLHQRGDPWSPDPLGASPGLWRFDWEAAAGGVRQPKQQMAVVAAEREAGGGLPAAAEEPLPRKG